MQSTEDQTIIEPTTQCLLIEWMDTIDDDNAMEVTNKVVKMALKSVAAAVKVDSWASRL